MYFVRQFKEIFLFTLNNKGKKGLYLIMKGGFQILLALLFCAITQVAAQNTPHFSQFLSAQSTFNPAYNGSQMGVNLEGIVRGQWLGIDGAPLSQTLSVHTPVPLFKSGIGLQVHNDLTGALRNSGLTVSYAYQLLQTKQSLLAIGISGGVFQQYLDGTQLVTPQGLYEDEVNHEDDLLSNNSTTTIAPNLNIGAYFQNEQLEIGLVAQNIIEPSFKNGLDEQIITQQKMTFNVYGSYTIDIGMRYLLRPFGSLITDMNNYQTNIGVIGTYDNFLSVGISFRGYNKNSVDALIGMLAYQISPKWQIGYAYDLTLSALRTATSQTHELTINYRLIDSFSSKSGNILYNPRFL